MTDNLPTELRAALLREARRWRGTGEGLVEHLAATAERLTASRPSPLASRIVSLAAAYESHAEGSEHGKTYRNVAADLRRVVAASGGGHVPECSCPPPYATCQHPPCACTNCVEQEIRRHHSGNPADWCTTCQEYGCRVYNGGPGYYDNPDGVA